MQIDYLYQESLEGVKEYFTISKLDQYVLTTPTKQFLPLFVSHYLIKGEKYNPSSRVFPFLILDFENTNMWTYVHRKSL